MNIRKAFTFNVWLLSRSFNREGIFWIRSATVASVINIELQMSTLTAHSKATPIQGAQQELSGIVSRDPVHRSCAPEDEEEEEEWSCYAKQGTHFRGGALSK